MVNLEIILSVAGTALGLLVTAVTFLIKFIRAVKNKNTTEATNILRQAAEEAVKYVEGVKSKTNGELRGAIKLEMALTKVNQALIDAGVKYDEKAAEAVIEEIVALTKTVNARDKDKAPAA